MAEEKKISTENNITDWKNLRAEGYLLTGYPLCTYSNIYIPNSEGKMYKVWSLNYSLDKVGNIPVIYDYPEFDIKWSRSDNPYSRIFKQPILDSLDFDNANKLHVGRLSPEAIEIIAAKTKGRGVAMDALLEYDGFVFYLPRQFRWVPEDELSSVTDKENISRKMKRLLALAAGLLTFTD